ncbi:GNAT family N-acetyltransferase [Sphingomonas colocasiae]|uniref:GNAT family N-acetyltransferase n=2 Tax=Sphingomonas colocasiae TaxID=1848973 RepID=A0ABS7PUR6_9SPHN|nr:GNAT family protein [Sphingomonas colocasiae]MBY8825115.1 GNAT family N-acetyltransferase [Sphingomonas colocasiae]
MTSPPVTLLPFADAHVEPLRAACAADPDIWHIYPIAMVGDRFDGSLAFIRARPNWVMFAVLHHEELVGMTSYIGLDEPGQIEIGATYIAPRMRGGPFNAAMKRLMIDRAFAHGFAAIQFRVDTRNTRSMRAVEKLGAKQVEIRKADLRTWTGFVRDTAVYRLDRGDWDRG